MSTKRTTTRTNAKNEFRYLVTVENPSHPYDTRCVLTMGASSLIAARKIWKYEPTKRIYKLVGSGRGVK